MKRLLTHASSQPTERHPTGRSWRGETKQWAPEATRAFTGRLSPAQTACCRPPRPSGGAKPPASAFSLGKTSPEQCRQRPAAEVLQRGDRTKKRFYSSSPAQVCSGADRPLSRFFLHCSPSSSHPQPPILILPLLFRWSRGFEGQILPCQHHLPSVTPSHHSRNHGRRSSVQDDSNHRADSSHLRPGAVLCRRHCRRDQQLPRRLCHCLYLCT